MSRPITATLVLILSLSTVAYGQDDDDDDDVAPEAEPEEAIAEPASTNPLTTETREAGDIRYRLLGFLRLEAAFIQDDPNVAFVGRNDGFRLQNARIGVEGSWRERVTVRVSADGAVDERDNPNETEGTLRFELIDAYADVKLASKLTLRIARFQALFDIERVTSPSRRTFARRAVSSRGVGPTEGFEKSGLAVKRNLGVALRSENILSGGNLVGGFELAVQNGNGSSDAANDNDALAYSGTVFAELAEAVFVFGAARYNRRNEGELPVRLTEDDLEFAVGARIEKAPFRATGQLLVAQTDFKTTGGKRNAFGAHGEALVTVPGLDWLEAGYRYSILEPSDLEPADRVQEHTIGANISWPAARALLQINGTHAVEQAAMSLDNSRIEAVLQVSL